MNKSVLVNSKVCQNCAECCKVFTYVTNKDTAMRFEWMKKVKVIETPFNSKDGTKLYTVIFQEPCKKLKQHTSGKYYCSVWDKIRPNFCSFYPDNIFEEALEDLEFVEKVRIFESQFCPALKNYTGKEICEKLKKSKSGGQKNEN